MKKIIILLLCCGVLVSMVGCGGNTALPPTENPPTTVSETTITETPAETTLPTTAVKPTEKEKESTPTKETAPSTTPQLAESETEETEPPFDIEHWIAYARSYAESKGFVLVARRWTVGTPLSAQAHTAFTLKEISKADLIAMQRMRISRTCGSGQKQQATIATTFISATLKIKIILSIKIPTGCGGSSLNFATTSGG